MTRRTTSYEGFICRFSIFTMVDWLTFESRARAVCVSPRAFRSRGTSSRSGIIFAGNGPEVHIPTGILKAIAYYWLANRPLNSSRPYPLRAPKFGGGVFLEPAYILLVGRATTMVNGERLPYRTVAIQAAHDYLTTNCTNLNVDADVTLDCKIGQGSVDLRGLYDTQKHLANDTSFGVGFAPFSELETVVLQTEQLINGPLKKDLKEVGQDIKVMGVRHDDEMRLTIAAAFVDRYVPDKDHYRSVVEELRERLLDNAVKYTDRSVKVDINTGDNYDAGIFYLTVTGLSAANGDDGSVGRGNRVSGLITPYRPMSMEAAAGKNPVTHVGKLYNLLSFDIADRLVREHEGKVKEVWVRIVSQIGNPIDEPQAATAQIIPEKGTHLSSIVKDAEVLIDEELEKIYKMTERIVEGKVHCF